MKNIEAQPPQGVEPNIGQATRKELFQKALRRGGIPSGVLGLSIVLAACGGGKGESEVSASPLPDSASTTQVEPQAQQQTENIPVSTTKPSPEPEEQAGPPPVEEAPVQPESEVTTPQPQAEPEEPPPPAPEAEKEVECQILPQEYCDQAERIMIKIGEAEVQYLGFNLPPETPLFAPFDGLLDKAQESGQPFSGFRGVVRGGSGGSVLRGDLDFGDMFSKEVKAGDKIGKIGDTGVESFGYNLLITITKRTPDGPVVDEDILRRLFPAAFEKPAESVNGGEIKSSPSISHSSTPPGEN